jgi:ribosomal protein S18 acetylase RimI-like enzyme
VIIGTATPDDAPAILALQKLAYASEARIYDDDSIPPLTQTLEELAAEFGHKTVLKAVEHSSLVGSVRGFAQGGVAHLERLIVHPASQGRGIGSALVARFEACFPDVERFELFTGHRSERNLALYSRLGYRPFRREAIHPGLELVHMEKRRR